MKNRYAIVGLAGMLAVLVACDGKSDKAATPSVESDTMPVAAPAEAVPTPANAAPDTAPGSSLPAAKASPTDSTGKTAASPAAKPAPAAPEPEHDIAVKPKFKIDEKTGKPIPIKRP